MSNVERLPSTSTSTYESGDDGRRGGNRRDDAPGDLLHVQALGGRDRVHERAEVLRAHTSAIVHDGRSRRSHSTAQKTKQNKTRQKHTAVAAIKSMWPFESSSFSNSSTESSCAAGAARARLTRWTYSYTRHSNTMIQVQVQYNGGTVEASRSSRIRTQVCNKSYGGRAATSFYAYSYFGPRFSREAHPTRGAQLHRER